MKLTTLCLMALVLAAPLPSLVDDDLTRLDGPRAPAEPRRPAPAAPVTFGEVERVEEITVEGVVERVWQDEILLRSFATSYLVDLWPHAAHELGIRVGETLRVVGLRSEESLIAVRITRADGTGFSFEAF